MEPKPFLDFSVKISKNIFELSSLKWALLANIEQQNQQYLFDRLREWCNIYVTNQF